MAFKFRQTIINPSPRDPDQICDWWNPLFSLFIHLLFVVSLCVFFQSVGYNKMLLHIPFFFLVKISRLKHLFFGCSWFHPDVRHHMYCFHHIPTLFQSCKPGCRLRTCQSLPWTSPHVAWASGYQGEIRWCVTRFLHQRIYLSTVVIDATEMPIEAHIYIYK